MRRGKGARDGLNNRRLRRRVSPPAPPVLAVVSTHARNECCSGFKVDNPVGAIPTGAPVEVAAAAAAASVGGVAATLYRHFGLDLRSLAMIRILLGLDLVAAGLELVAAGLEILDLGVPPPPKKKELKGVGGWW